MRFQVNKVWDEKHSIAMLLQKREFFSLDIEAVSIENPLPLGIAIAIDPTTAFYFFDMDDSVLKVLFSLGQTLIIQNAKFDIPILKTLGFTVGAYEDTMMLACANGYLDRSLEGLSWALLQKENPSVTTLWKKPKQGNIAINHQKLGSLSMIHAMNTYNIWLKMPKNRLYYGIDKPCVELIMEMEKWGLLIDQHRLTEVEQDAMLRVGELETQLYAELGEINLNSNPQIVTAFQARGIIGTRKTKSGKESVSDESLAPLNNPLANLLLAYRSEMKTLSTYVPAFRSPDHLGRIHTNFGNTRTGRWKTKEPNLQNITKTVKGRELGLRHSIVAEKGYTFLAPDVSQIELRVIAILSKDPAMLEALRSEDLHMATAIQVFGWIDDEVEMTDRRRLAKAANFAVVFGAGDFELSQMLGMSVLEAGEFLRRYFTKYHVLNDWMLTQIAQAKVDGYVTTAFGRIRPIPELASPSWKTRSEGERQVVNTIVQGTAADYVKQMMLYLRSVMSARVRIVLQVHDEILLEVPDAILEETRILVESINQVFPDYPIKNKVGKCYGTMQSV